MRRAGYSAVGVHVTRWTKKSKQKTEKFVKNCFYNCAYQNRTKAEEKKNHNWTVMSRQHTLIAI